MANYRPLIVNDSANQIQELNESNDSLMLKEIVGISQNTDKLNLSTSGDMKIEIGGNESARFQTNSVDFSAASNALSVNLGAASGLASIVNFKAPVVILLGGRLRHSIVPQQVLRQARIEDILK